MASLLKNLSNWFRAKKDDAADKLADPVRDGKYAIEDSKTKIADFRTKIAKLVASTKQLEREKIATEADKKKWDGIAKKAAEAGNAEHVTEAVTKREAAKEAVTTKKTQIAKNKEIETQLRKQLQGAQNKIATAESNHSRLSAQLEGAKVRKELAAASSEFADGSSPLSALDNLQSAVDLAECDAEATEELAGVGTSSLDEVYSSTNSNVEDEVAKLMAAAQK